MIEVDHTYYLVELNRRLDNEVIEYLLNHFGPAGERWFFRFPNLYFHNSKDHLMFTLRWA